MSTTRLVTLGSASVLGVIALALGGPIRLDAGPSLPRTSGNDVLVFVVHVEAGDDWPAALVADEPWLLTLDSNRAMPERPPVEMSFLGVIVWRSVPAPDT